MFANVSGLDAVAENRRRSFRFRRHVAKANSLNKFKKKSQCNWLLRHRKPKLSINHLTRHCDKPLLAVVFILFCSGFLSVWVQF